MDDDNNLDQVEEQESSFQRGGVVKLSDDQTASHIISEGCTMARSQHSQLHMVSRTPSIALALALINQDEPRSLFGIPFRSRHSNADKGERRE